MNFQESLGNIYSEHNKKKRGEYFVTMEKERGPFLREAVGVGKKVLDLGCRDGALTKYFSEGNTVLGLDIDKEALERAKKIIPIQTKLVDLNAFWDVEQKSFDVVAAAEVLEHLYHPNIVLEKVVKVLKRDGVFVGSIPYAYSVQSKIRFLFGVKRHTPLQDPTHINHFTYKEFSDLLNKYFNNVYIKPVISKKFKIFSTLLPFSFAHMLLFVAKSPKDD